MYLLNPISGKSGTPTTTLFTFHYVSIKSAWANIEPEVRITFTFHYVSIKSQELVHAQNFKTNLHSTMYLLNLRSLYTLRTSKPIYIPLCIY